MARQRAPKTTILNLQRAWQAMQAIDAGLAILGSTVPPNPTLFAVLKMFHEYRDNEFSLLRATDAPKVDPPSLHQAARFVSSFSIERTDLDDPSTLVPGTLPIDE